MRAFRIQYLLITALVATACGRASARERPGSMRPSGQTSTSGTVYRSDLPTVYNNQVSLDVHYTEENKSKPVVLFLHGGGWISGDKESVVTKAQLGEFFKQNGYLLVSANYRLVDVAKWGNGSPTYREQASDVAHAIAWVKKNAASHGGDPEQIVLAGHSAGAHLAPLVATDPSYLASVGLSLSAVKKVISFDVHAYDIPRAIELMSIAPGFSSQITSLTKMFGGTRDEQLSASPEHFVSRDRRVAPMLILSAGIKDGKQQDIAKTVSQEFVQTLKNAGHLGYHYHYETEDHTSIVTDINTTGDAPARAVKAFLKDEPLP